LGSRFSVCNPPATIDAVSAEIGDAVAILDASMKVPLRGELLEQAGKLKLVVTATTGADHIDGGLLEERGIPLLTLKGQRQVLEQLTPAAELSWLLLMACARRLRPAIHHVEDGGWNRELFPGIMLNGRTLGLVGCGRIGQWMGRYANAFGMRTLGYDPYLEEWPAHISRADLDNLLSLSDFVSIHVHLSEETRGLINAERLALAKHGVIFINTSRGAIIDENALISALENGRVSAYGCDVLEGEPQVTSTRIWQYAREHPECVITPHIGGFSPDALDVVLRFSASRVVSHFGG
jgi:D-3-phosphoglycerate dehydrogenase